jgi:hypothetical protein
MAKILVAIVDNKVVCLKPKSRKNKPDWKAIELLEQILQTHVPQTPPA